VGNGISVGDGAAARRAWAFDKSVTPLGRGGTTDSSSPSTTGDVGDGTAVGTGISVGEDGCVDDLACFVRAAAGLGGAMLNCSDGVGGSTEVGTMPRENTGISDGVGGSIEVGVGRVRGRLTGTGGGGTSSSEGTWDVGEGTAVGTGISVGDDGTVDDS